MTLKLTSPVFEQNRLIPSSYTCDGEGVNPPLAISGVPKEADSLILLMDDSDIPQMVKESRGIDKFNHWAVYNLDTSIERIEVGQETGEPGLNSVGNVGYTGPCPPSQYEPAEHRYVFRLYAIKGQLEFSTIPTLDEIEDAAQAKVIEQAELVGRYRRDY